MADTNRQKVAVRPVLPQLLEICRKSLRQLRQNRSLRHILRHRKLQRNIAAHLCHSFHRYLMSNRRNSVAFPLAFGVNLLLQCRQLCFRRSAPSLVNQHQLHRAAPVPRGINLQSAHILHRVHLPLVIRNVSAEGIRIKACKKAFAQLLVAFRILAVRPQFLQCCLC